MYLTYIISHISVSVWAYCTAQRTDGNVEITFDKLHCEETVKLQLMLLKKLFKTLVRRSRTASIIVIGNAVAFLWRLPTHHVGVSLDIFCACA